MLGDEMKIKKKPASPKSKAGLGSPKNLYA
jgi:hypothetical protein